MTAPLYKIANWHALYEPCESRRSNGPMKWVSVVTKTDGFGFGLLRQEKNNVELLAAWYLLLGIAAKQNIELRGTIMRDGQPLTADDLELITGFPAKIFSAAFAFFSQPRQGWLVKEDFRPVGTKMFSLEQKCSGLNKNVPTGQDTTGQDTTEQNMTVGKNAAGAASAVVSDSSSSEPAKPATDAEWLETLRVSPAYRGIDVLREHAKAGVWCAEKRKKLSRARFINWLNRVDAPMTSQSAIPGHSRPAPPEPDDWRAWISEHAPDSVYSRGGTHEGAQWGALDAATQDWLTKQTQKNKFQKHA